MAEAKTTPPAPTTGTKAAELSLHTYEVHIPGNKPLTIQAVSEADAIHRYKQQMGIIASPHEPTVTRTSSGNG
jgi:hypothetical protein